MSGRARAPSACTASSAAGAFWLPLSVAQTSSRVRARGEGFDVLGDGGFGTVGERDDQPSPGLRGRQRRGQHAVDAAQLAGQRKLAEEFVISQGLAVDLPAGSQDAEGDRQVEPAAVLR